MNEIDLKKIVGAILDVVRFILVRKGLSNSNIYKKTEIKIVGEDVIVLMPDYTTFVDSGRRAGRMPPIKSIVKWIREKNINIPSNYTLEQFAFAIAKNISKKGTKGKNFLEQISTNVQELIFDFINKEINKKINAI